MPELAQAQKKHRMASEMIKHKIQNIREDCWKDDHKERRKQVVQPEVENTGLMRQVCQVNVTYRKSKVRSDRIKKDGNLPGKSIHKNRKIIHAKLVLHLKIDRKKIILTGVQK